MATASGDSEADRGRWGRRRPGARRGTIAAALVVALPTLMVVIGLALEVALVGAVREQLQGAADSAALAGAAELFDEDALVPGAVGDGADDRAAAADAAALFANYNLALGRPEVDLSDHPCRVDFGRVEDPTDPASPFVPTDGPAEADTVLVTIERSRRMGNAVPVRLGALFGVVPATVIVTARATLDRRVYGVRPMGAIPTPLVPLVADASSWAAQAQAPPTAGGNDNFRVDARAGRVEPGSDGIPEIVLQAPGPGASPSPADNLGVLALGPGRVDPEAVARILADGVRPADLSVWSGQFALEDEAGALDVAGRAEVDAGVVDGLRSIVGAGRVWPLAGPRVDAGAEAVFPVVDFGAGRVVAAWVDDAGRAVVVVQPTQLVTATALVRAGRPANRWIGKVSLTQ